MIKKICLLLLSIALPAMSYAQCTVSVPSVNISQYKALDQFENVSLVSGEVRCDIPSVVKLRASEGGSNSYTQRTLSSGMNSLGYNLYIGTNASYIWGDGTSGTSEMTVNAGSSTSITANLRIPAGQNPPSGWYSDTVTFTVIF